MPTDYDYTPVFSGAEYIFTVLAVVGAIACVIGIIHARRAISYLHRTGQNGRRLRFARNNLRVESGLFLVLLTLTIFGVLSILAPPTPTQAHPTLQTWVGFTMFMEIAIVLFVMSVLQQIDFFIIRRNLDRDFPDEPEGYEGGD